MRCEACRESLSPFLDGVCSEKENKMMEAHLAVCSDCRAQLEEMRRMVELFHLMPLPSLPDDFAESFHRRLDAENLIMFSPHEFKVPRKQSWIAAAIAGVALAGGIYASTVLPLGPMIANWQEKQQDNDQKPKVAVNDVIKRLNGQNTANLANNTANKAGDKAIGSNAPDTADKVNTPDSAQDAAKDADNSPVSIVAAKNEQHMAAASSVRLTVASANDTRKQVLQIASANGLSYSYNNNGCLELLSGPVAQGITLKVAAQDADKVMGQLAALGKASKPEQSSVDMTDKFKELQTTMDQVQGEKTKLAAQATLTQQEQQRLNELNAQMQTLTDKKAQLEKEANLVTINVYFVEEVKP